MELVLTSTSLAKQTLGFLQVLEKGKELYCCHTLELPWVNNDPRLSCIPAGKYPVRKLLSKTESAYAPCFSVDNVAGRQLIRIHIGNYFSDTRGCILPGLSLADINGDGQLDVKSSGLALKKLLSLLPIKTTLTIIRT